MLRCASQRYTGMVHACMCVCVCVWKGEGRGVGRVSVVVSCVCVWANVYACICHSRDRKKIFLVCKDKNKVLSLEP